MTRAYHGAHIKEGHWERMFKTHMPSVAPMDHRYLAQHDGSEQAAGRGSGVDQPPNAKEKTPLKTPYMQMVYHPLERRLDTAIFRALFASSVKQARQFIVHGAVKVNGKRVCSCLADRSNVYRVLMLADDIPRLHAEPRRYVLGRSGARHVCYGRSKRAT